MSLSRESLLRKLPPYQDEWVLVHPDQTVKDIIVEILNSHDEFAPYYDKIALYFNSDTVKEICKTLYDFCKKNIEYEEETEADQTTALPTGILVRGYGDCKHYASFCGGILDAINRLTGKHIKWNYRFASYNVFDKTPHHVFICVYDGNNEIWIDPTPGAIGKTPMWQVDKTIKAETMAINKNIAGIGTHTAIGIASLTVTPVINTNPWWAAKGVANDNNLIFDDGINHYPAAFNPYLGLSQYRDYGGDRNISESTVANLINAEIDRGPMPGHTVTPDFVKWVYNSNIRSWNFYYPMGVKPGFTALNLLPDNYPKLVISADGRLMFDRDVKIDDWRNPEIHLLVAWAQALVNQYDPTPYPVKPLHLKEFSQLLYGNVDTRNLFTERRGTSVFTDIGKAIEDTVNFVKDATLTIIGSIPRNAFLALTGLNIFNMAGNMYEHIVQGNWDHMAKTWESIGGNPDKLRGTIEDGKDKPAILGSALGVIGVDDVAAFLAAASPIIVIMLQFINKDGKFNDVIKATEAALTVQFPGNDFSFLDGALTMNGAKVNWQIAPSDNENLGGGNNDLPGQSLLKNPMVIAAAAGIGTYFIVNKRGQKKNYMVPVVVGGAVYLLMTWKKSAASSMTPAQKRQALINWVNQTATSSTDKTTSIAAFTAMTDTEINYAYDFIFNYFQKGIKVPVDGLLYTQIQAISTKYHIFT